MKRAEGGVAWKGIGQGRDDAGEWRDWKLRVRASTRQVVFGKGQNGIHLQPFLRPG